MTPEECRSRRERLGWTQDRLARVAGLSLPTIRQFEAGACTPRAGTRIALAKALRAATVLQGAP